MQERQVDDGDDGGERRAARRLGPADRLQGHQMGEPHGRDGPGGRRRAGSRGGVRVRRSRRAVEHGADAPERQPPDHRPEQPAEPVGRVREVGPGTGEEEKRARPVHHTHQVRAAERMQAHRLRDQRLRQGHVGFPGEVRQRPVRIVCHVQPTVPAEEEAKDVIAISRRIHRAVLYYYDGDNHRQYL